MKKSDVIQHFGSASKTAKALNISRASVCGWGETVPPLRALQIEEMTEGLLKADRSKIWNDNFVNSSEADVTPTNSV